MGIFLTPPPALQSRPPGFSECRCMAVRLGHSAALLAPTCSGDGQDTRPVLGAMRAQSQGLLDLVNLSQFE